MLKAVGDLEIQVHSFSSLLIFYSTIIGKISLQILAESVSNELYITWKVL